MVSEHLLRPAFVVTQFPNATTKPDAQFGSHFSRMALLTRSDVGIFLHQRGFTGAMTSHSQSTLKKHGDNLATVSFLASAGLVTLATLIASDHRIRFTMTAVALGACAAWTFMKLQTWQRDGATIGHKYAASFMGFALLAGCLGSTAVAFSASGNVKADLEKKAAEPAPVIEAKPEASSKENYGYGPEDSTGCYRAGESYALAYEANKQIVTDEGVTADSVMTAGCAKHPPNKCEVMCKAGFIDRRNFIMHH
jgi:hypothetical protein